MSPVLAAELSATSAVFFFDRLFLAGAAESSGAAVSALAVAFFFDFDFGVFAESALASALLCGASAAAFFLLFFLVAVLLHRCSLPSLRFAYGPVHSQLTCAGGLGGVQACLAGIPQWNARIILEKQGEVKVKGNA